MSAQNTTAPLIQDPVRQYKLQDVMRRRKKKDEEIREKVKSKLINRAEAKKADDKIHKPEYFVKKYRAAQKSYANLRRKTAKLIAEDVQVDKERVVLVVRIRGINDISSIQRRILNSLNLREVNSAVFLKLTKKNLLRIKRVENYVTYGYPSRKLIQQLIYKRLFIRQNNERKQINTNALVEQHFGGKLLCLQDLINEISNCGTEFDRITEFVWPFKLTTNKNVIPSRLRKPFTEGGEWGFRDTQINQFALKMV